MLFFVVLSAILLSLVYSFVFQIKPLVDARAYDTIAQNLLSGNGFREDPSLPFVWDNAIMRAGPAYEFFLAGVYWLFGHSYAAVWVIQALLRGLSVFLLYLTTKEVFSSVKEKKKIAIFAAALFAFWPDLIEISAMLMTETLYLFFTILSLYFFTLSWKKPESLSIALGLGLVTGIGVLTRPTLLFFLFVYLFFYATKRAYKSLLVCLVAAILTLIPWAWRNYQVYNEIILTTRIGEYNIWLGNLPESTGGQWVGDDNPLREYTTANGFTGLKEVAQESFLSFITAHPLSFVRLTLLRCVRYFSLIRPMGFWFYQQGISQMLFVGSSLLYIAAMFLAGFSGLVYLVRKKKDIFVYLAVLLFMTAFPILLTVVQARYRFQAYPILAIAAAYGLYMLRRGFKTFIREPVVRWTVAFLLCVSLIDVWVYIPIIVERIQGFFA